MEDRIRADVAGDLGFSEDDLQQRLAIFNRRRLVAPRAAQAPTDPDGFDTWLTDLTATGPGQGDPLFPWLEHTASMDQMKWVLAQEVAGEAGFEDLTALTQVKMPVGPKL